MIKPKLKNWNKNLNVFLIAQKKAKKRLLKNRRSNNQEVDLKRMKKFKKFQKFKKHKRHPKRDKNQKRMRKWKTKNQTKFKLLKKFQIKAKIKVNLKRTKK